METLAKAPIEQKMGRIVRNVVNGAIKIGEAVAMLPFYCGSTDKGKHVHDHPLDYGDKPGIKVITGYSSPSEIYDPAKHGAITAWVNEGDEVPSPIHRHNDPNKSNSSGSVEYKFE